MASKNNTKTLTIADRLADLRGKVAAAQAEADAARYAAGELTARVAAAEEVTAEEWRDLPAAASLAEAKVAGLRAALDQVEAEATEDNARQFVAESYAKLGQVPEVEGRLRRLAEGVKAELDAIVADADEYNESFWAIHQAARIGTGRMSNSFYGATTNPLIQDLGMRVDHNSAGKIIYVHGEEFRDVGTLGLADDVAQIVRELDAAEAPAPYVPIY